MSNSAAFDEMVSSMVALGVPRAKAEATARTEMHRRGLGPLLPPEPTLDERKLEKEEQHEISRLFRAYGFKVRSTSQARASKVAPGLPDLFVTHLTRPIAFWWESKRQVGGKLDPAQEEFRDDCLRCQIPWASGHRYDAAQLLVDLGLAAKGDGPCGIVPLRESTPST